ncbi:MAG: tRNA dihydrouridine synthase DusB [Clostridia bacterium]|nr:tRNA dihydrouridine synthase DusB [Clostridia bacterium]
MKIGNLVLNNPFVLGPMAGVTDSAFRRICKSYGCDLVFSEMISSKGLYFDDHKTERLLKISEEEGLTALQIFGSDPSIMAFAAEKLSHRKNEILDINMGCPVPKIVKNGDGSALLKDPKLLKKIVEAVVKAAGKPVSVKIRTGWDKNSINVLEIAKIIEDSGASFITVHGRTREQFYSGQANWELIKQVKESVDIPVIGSGDVFTKLDAVRMLQETNCDGVMIARGAQGRPWIFEEALSALHNQTYQEPSIEEKIKTIKKHLLLLIEDKGEYVAIREMRKHLGWYFKGLRHATEIRRRVNEIDNKDEMILMLDEYARKNIE